MASKRMAKSAVDWAAFYERVPHSQRDAYRALKAKNDQFITKVHQNPENLPKIDWAFFKSRIPIAGLVESFEKAYADVKVPYPTDKDNVVGKVDAQEKEAQVQSKKFVERCNSDIKDAKLLLEKIEKLPKLEDMTVEMVWDYFPESRYMQPGKPSFWPHTKEYQPENLGELNSTKWGNKVLGIFKPSAAK